ncbi:hypothetical protein KCMC57_up00070 [Kitasatospora sp. CMC57]|uniref:Diguanylate cyclase n=1 Tax=Kitasatospora sp. CMC57 TaxID=3231513 RepID=A0AB33KE92_9ACTN
MLEKRTGQPARQTPGEEPAVAAFIGFLNQLFTALAVSLTRYAARVNRDKGSVSRYLSGRRIAPTDFIEELLRQVADVTGSPVTDDVRVQAHHLRLEALRVRNASQYEVEQLRESLGAAERELHLASVRERALLRAVEAAEDQTGRAEQRFRQLESDWAAAHYASKFSELDIYAQPDGSDELRDEIRGLKAELDALRSELSRAQTMRYDAEERCLRLEARLLAAEAALQTERTRAREKAALELESPPEDRVDPETLHRVLADINTAQNLASTLQAVVGGAVHGLGFDVATVSLVRPDGDLVVAAAWAIEESAFDGHPDLLGQVGSGKSWERMLSVADHWGTLRFLPAERLRAVGTDIPSWTGDGPPPTHPDDWHPQDILIAPMYKPDGDLLGVLSVYQPRSGKRHNVSSNGALEKLSLQASIAIGNARLRAEMQRALARLEKEQQALRASEESFRQTFEYAPSGMAVTELHGAAMGQLTRVNDALCRLLGWPRATLRQQRFADLVHPDDLELLQRTSAEGGRAELRLSRRDGGFQWVCLRNSVVADAAEGPSFLLTHVEDIEERKRHEFQLAHRASHDALTGLPNREELRARLARRLCAEPQTVSAGEQHVHAVAPGAAESPSAHRRTPSGPSHQGGQPKGLAVLFGDLDGFRTINHRFGHAAGDAVLVEVARRLQQASHDGDTVARFGGDEFVVLTDGIGCEEAEALAHRLRNAVTPPMRIDGRAVRVGISLGIGWASCGISIDEVLHQADMRMYNEKEGRSGAVRRP